METYKHWFCTWQFIRKKFQQILKQTEKQELYRLHSDRIQKILNNANLNYLEMKCIWLSLNAKRKIKTKKISTFFKAKKQEIFHIKLKDTAQADVRNYMPLNAFIIKH